MHPASYRKAFWSKTRELGTPFEIVFYHCSALTDFTVRLNISANFTKNWLIDVLITAIREHSISETIGAPVALALLLEDDDARCVTTVDLIMSTPTDYRAEFLASDPGRSFDFSVNGDFSSHPKRLWVGEIALRMLVSSSWSELTSECMHNCVLILTELGHFRSVILDRLGIRSELQAIVSAFFEPDQPERSDSKGAIVGKEIRYGIVDVEYTKLNPVLNWATWQSATWDALSNTSGFIRACF